MALYVELFQHPKAGYFYAVFQYNRVYELNVFERPGVRHCVFIGELWPQGEADLGLKLGSQILMDDAPMSIKKEVMTIITNTITHV